MVTLKTPEEIAAMREGGRRLARVLQILKEEVKPGVKTIDLDRKAREIIEEGGDKPSFLGYEPSGADKPFPFTLCASINDEVVHGLPSDYEIKDGDLVKLDLGLIHDGLHVDSAITVPVGKVSEETARLVKTTYEALEAGIKASRLGNTLGDIGAAIEGRIKKDGFGIVKALTGHGIGKDLHEDPYIFNFGTPGAGPELREGMTIAIEPMITLGNGRVKQRKDDSFITSDGSFAAHFEHTIAITKDGPKILTVT